MAKFKKYKTLKEYREYLTKDNNWAFKLDWDFSFSKARTDIIEIMDIVSGMDILDVGCANGKTLEFIKNGYNVGLYGVEPDKKLAEEASQYGKIFAGSIEDYLKKCRLKFDAIIMADVIEHLEEPWIVVRDLTKHLKDGGAIYSSIPNIMHAGVVLNLFMNGTFAYNSNDIINKGHLRFFTINDCAALFKMVGLNKCLVSGVKADFPEESIEKAKLLGNVFGRDDYYFDIYQFLIKATRD